MSVVTDFTPGNWSAHFEGTFVYDGIRFTAWWSTDEGWYINENPAIKLNWTDTEWDQFYSALEDLPTPQIQWDI